MARVSPREEWWSYLSTTKNSLKPTTRVSGPMHSKDEILLASLQKFYEDPARLRALTDVIVHRVISLRVIDWCVTNYAKRLNVIYPLDDGHGEIRGFRIHTEYKAMLKGYNKVRFDPFGRRTRVVIQDADGRPMKTTVAQLNFFRWCIRCKVLEYCLTHAKAIERDMLCSMKAKTASSSSEDDEDATETRKKRRELSTAATKKLTKSTIVLTLKFS